MKLRWLVSLVPLSFFACSSATLSHPPGGSSGDTPPPDTLPDGAPAGDGGILPDGAKSDGSSGGPDSSAPLAYTQAVKIIVEPGDNGQALVAAIQGAKTSVHMTMYLLSNSNVINALVAQKNMGHDVKVVLNQTFPSGQGSNQGVYNTLKNAGVSVVWAPSAFSYTHEKCAIIDNATAWIMTMNATQTAPVDNREYLAVDTDPQDVQVAEAVFQGDFTNTASNAPGKLVLAPVNAEDRIAALINTATKSIDLEGEELSDTVVVNALAARADAGVKVRIVLAGAGVASQQQAVATLKQHKIPVVALSSPYVHAKAAVVDGARAYVGSENFSAGSLRYNRELGVLFDTASEVSKVGSTIAGDFAAGSPL